MSQEIKDRTLVFTLPKGIRVKLLDFLPALCVTVMVYWKGLGQWGLATSGMLLLSIQTFMTCFFLGVVSLSWMWYMSLFRNLLMVFMLHNYIGYLSGSLTQTLNALYRFCLVTKSVVLTLGFPKRGSQIAFQLKDLSLHQQILLNCHTSSMSYLRESHINHVCSSLQEHNLASTVIW